MKQFQAGGLVDQGTYRSFSPTPLDRPWQIDDMGLIQLLGEAERELGRLDMFSEYVPNVDLYIRMHVLKEATQSSRIEGTRTNIAEAGAAGPTPSRSIWGYSSDRGPGA